VTTVELRHEPVVNSATGADRSHKPKYVLLAPWTVKAGAGVNSVILGLQEAMRQDCESAIVITDWNPPSLPGQSWVRCRLPHLPLTNLLGFLLFFLPTTWRLNKVLRGAAVVNPHYPGPALLPLVLLRRIGSLRKLIVSVHGSDVVYATRASRLEKALYRMIFASADAVVACSQSLCRDVQSVSPEAKTICVPNGIPKPPDKLGVRPIPGAYLVSVAAFTENKGHAVLIDAFLQVSKTYPDLKLVLIGGDGPNRKVIQAKVAELGLADRVRLLVNVPHDDVWSWIGHAECFVHAAWREAFGIAILEAGLLETPVVATAVDGVAEYLISGVNSLTCEPGKDKQMASAILDVLGDRLSAERRARKLHQTATQYTWQRAWEKYKLAAGL